MACKDAYCEWRSGCNVYRSHNLPVSKYALKFVRINCDWTCTFLTMDVFRHENQCFIAKFIHFMASLHVFFFPKNA
jgi:hypothetical protein